MHATKNPYVGSHVYANALTHPETEPATPVPAGIYDGLDAFRNRLASLNSTLAGLIYRIYGPRPQTGGTNPAKDAEKPSLTQISIQAGGELTMLEKQIAEIVNFIG